MNTLIRARGLGKDYGEHVAVDDVSFDVGHGECVAVLGPNGAGKTTTIEMLEGYRRPERGELTVLGSSPWRAPAQWRSRVGIVLQTTRAGDTQTVREQVVQFASFYPRPADVDATIAAVGLTEHAGRRIDRLSGGQQRRLDVALGIIGQPEVLFLDEPTTGFDPEARRQFWELIRGLRRSGTAIVLTTHYLDEAAALADRVVVLAGGRVVADAAPALIGGADGGRAVVTWTEHGERHEAATDQPTKLVSELAVRFGGEVPDLTVRRRSLEDAYLELLGGSR